MNKIKAQKVKKKKKSLLSKVDELLSLALSRVILRGGRTFKRWGYNGR
jgi:hypothetical protein